MTVAPANVMGAAFPGLALGRTSGPEPARVSRLAGVLFMGPDHVALAVLFSVSVSLPAKVSEPDNVNGAPPLIDREPLFEKVTLLLSVTGALACKPPLVAVTAPLPSAVLLPTMTVAPFKTSGALLLGFAL